ncbi:MAG: DUF4838 domain-containing protein [Ignavibacteriae bacterium]|nr:DUF4838 domain-containing protein [Ignavibacteriota bacterium]
MKAKILIKFIFLLFLKINIVFSQNNYVRINEWITEWNLIGPFQLEESIDNINHLQKFEKDYLIEFGGENNFTFNYEKIIQVNEEKLKWTKIYSKDSIINLDEAISKKSYITAYAYKEINFENDGTYIFSLGTNDGGKLWINDIEVWDYSSGRGLKPDENLIPVLMKKGKNKILLKIEERGNYWGFCARFINFKIDKYLEQNNIFNVVSFPNGKAELRFSLNKEIVKNLFKEVKLEIFSDEFNNKLIWSGIWNQKNIMELSINENVFKKYLLKISAERNDNKFWNKTIQFNSGVRSKYVLFENKKTAYKIVVGKDAFESEIWAASELQNILHEISGANFPLEYDDSEISKNEIVVGINKHSEKLLGNNYPKLEFNNEIINYVNVSSSLILFGGAQRGTMYSVFSFLENEFGVRWYTPKVSVIPKKNKYTFEYFNHQEKPFVQVRNDFYYEAFNPIWAAHNKINGAMGFREQHGRIEGYWSVHTFYRFMPPSEFYDKHPEYYSLIDGERIHENAQLCLTNPEVLEIVTERLKKVMIEEPSNLIYSVSQNDWRNPCQCENCQAIVKREESESGVVVWFVNQVAEKIKKEFPDKYVGTLAYQYTRNAPKNIKPNENVVIRLCSIECCFSHDFTSCPENQEFLTDLNDWAKISPHLYIWDYIVNFSHYILPYPNFYVLQPNIKTFHENNSIGIMEQAAYQSRGGEFAELRAYLISKLLWNSDANVEKIIDDFMFGYYGRSGQYIREYFDLLHSQITSDTHIHLGLKTDDVIFSNEFIEKSDEIFNNAEIVAENKEIKERVELARLPLMYLKCSRDPLNSKYDGTYERFKEIVDREGITHFAEDGKPHLEAFHKQIINAK